MKVGIGDVFAWAVLMAIVWFVGVGLVATTSAQQKPYQAYKVYDGCLYITPQGFAVLQPGFVVAEECK